MRVISQDGTIDVPYDNSSLTMPSGKYKDVEVAYIYCYNSSSPNGTKLAEYSTKEKAIKALEMLRKYYDNLTFMCLTVDTPQFNSFVARVTEKRFLESTKEYFRFPQDDEIEV